MILSISAIMPISPKNLQWTMGLHFYDWMCKRKTYPHKWGTEKRTAMPMRSLWAVTLAVAASLLPAIAFAAPMLFKADLTPLNDSGVWGSALLTLNGNQLTVKINATGLEPNEIHPQHIHGFYDVNGKIIKSTNPTLAQDDKNHDGFIEDAEGAKAYGPVMIPLTSPPGGALANYPTAPNGTINFMETYNLNDPKTFAGGFTKTDLMPLNFREIGLHGMTVPSSIAAVDGIMGSGSKVYDPLLPIATGEIMAVNSVPEPASLALLVIGLVALVSHTLVVGSPGGLSRTERLA